MPRVKSGSSTVIGIRVSSLEYFKWNNYCEIKDLSFSQFIGLIMNEFLEWKLLRPVLDAEIISGIMESLKGKIFENPITQKTITFRVKNKILEKWDKTCTRLYLSRTALIKQAINYFYHQDPSKFPQPNALETVRLMNVLYNLILNIGLLSFNQISEIFKHSSIDEWELNKMLEALESQGKIGRKGEQSYMPTVSIKKSMGIRAVSELLVGINNKMKEQISPVDNLEHSSLASTIFDYFDIFLNRINEPEKKSHIIKSKEAVVELKNNLSEILNFPL
jgi:hypothetical protein